MLKKLTTYAVINGKKGFLILLGIMEMWQLSRQVLHVSKGFTLALMFQEPDQAGLLPGFDNEACDSLRIEADSPSRGSFDSRPTKAICIFLLVPRL